MPPSTRRRVLPPPQPPQLQRPPALALQQQQQQQQGHFVDPPTDSEASELEPNEEDEEELMADFEGEIDEDEAEDEDQLDPHPSPHVPPLPPNLREISSLASWTVSSSKPGCSIPQLRSPNTSLFWQSDGPQPHMLNIHFFKMVSIVGMRLYLDFNADESYTPTHIVFAAGTGQHDLQEWADMRLEEPRGWVNVDFDGVGRMEDSDDDMGPEDDDDVDSEDEYDEDEDDDLSDMSLSNRRRKKKRRRRTRLPVLRAMLVQIRILENHQNGKDTHLRGLQIFARDKTRTESGSVPAVATTSTAAAMRASSQAVRDSLGRSSLGANKDKWRDDALTMMMPGMEMPDLR